MRYHNHTHLTAIMLLTTLFWSLGCSESSPSGTDDSSRYGTSQQYFPLDIGDTWTYSRSNNLDMVLTITGDTIVEGRSYRVARTDEEHLYYRWNGDTLLEWSIDFGSTERIVMVASNISGKEWSFTNPSEHPRRTLFSSVVERGGEHTVRDSTYMNVLHVRGVLRSEFSENEESRDLSVRDEYYAPGIGLIERTNYTLSTKTSRGEQLKYYMVR